VSRGEEGGDARSWRVGAAGTSGVVSGVEWAALDGLWWGGRCRAHSIGDLALVTSGIEHN
jgi:hypothetical protein